MQLFKKRKEGSSGGNVTLLAWHPDFRNVRELPDTKTIRTKFFINAGAILACLGALIYLVYSEYTLRAVRQEAAALQKTIDATAPMSRKAIALYSKYKTEDARLRELSAFTAGERLPLSDFIFELAETLPDHVTITGVQYRGPDIVIRGTIKGASELASGTASSFEKQLKESSKFGKHFASVSTTLLSRDANTGFFNLELTLKFPR